MSVQVPHFRHPFSRTADGTRVIVVEQGTTEHVQSQALNVIACPVGFRLDRPEYGWPIPMFQNAPLDTGPLQDALERFVGQKVDVSEYADSVQAAARHLSVVVDVKPGADSD